jgi:hypothetical protein
MSANRNRKPRKLAAAHSSKFAKEYRLDMALNSAFEAAHTLMDTFRDLKG